MIEVGEHSGLYFDKGNKGHFDILFHEGFLFKSNRYMNLTKLVGDNVDCSGEIFEAILRYGPFKDTVDAEKFLKDNEGLIKECIKEQIRGQKSIAKCYKGGLYCDEYNYGIDENGEEHECCPPMCISPDWIVERTKIYGEIAVDKKASLQNMPLTNFKDFDLRSPLICAVRMQCRIKSIRKPKLENGKYTQNCIFYDDGTSKTITGRLLNDVADFDKWNSGDKVEIVGRWVAEKLHVWSMKKVEDDTAEAIVINRNVESPGYDAWRDEVVSRDRVCQCCGLDNHLEGHHMFGYAEHPELATDVNNGIALCTWCHKKYHSIYGVKNINPKDLVEFVRKYGVR